MCICVPLCTCVSPFPVLWDDSSSARRLSATAPPAEEMPDSTGHGAEGREAERAFCSALKESRDLLFLPLTSTLSSNSWSPSFGGLPVLHCNFFKQFSVSSQGGHKTQTWSSEPEEFVQGKVDKQRSTLELLLELEGHLLESSTEAAKHACRIEARSCYFTARACRATKPHSKAGSGAVLWTSAPGPVWPPDRAAGHTQHPEQALPTRLLDEWTVSQKLYSLNKDQVSRVCYWKQEY